MTISVTLMQTNEEVGEVDWVRRRGDWKPPPPKKKPHLFSQFKKEKKTFLHLRPNRPCNILFGHFTVITVRSSSDPAAPGPNGFHRRAAWLWGLLKHRWPNFHPAELNKLIFQLFHFQGGVNRNHSSNKHIGLKKTSFFWLHTFNVNLKGMN